MANWPSNVFRMFCRKESPTGDQKESAKFGVVLNITLLWAAHVWRCSNISELWNKSATQRWPLCLRQVWRSL